MDKDWHLRYSKISRGKDMKSNEQILDEMCFLDNDGKPIPKRTKEMFNLDLDQVIVSLERAYRGEAYHTEYIKVRKDFVDKWGPNER